MSEKILDILAGLALWAVLTYFALAYFDILTK
jgi:hypothetical protein